MTGEVVVRCGDLRHGRPCRRILGVVDSFWVHSPFGEYLDSEIKAATPHDIIGYEDRGVGPDGVDYVFTCPAHRYRIVITQRELEDAIVRAHENGTDVLVGKRLEPF